MLLLLLPLSHTVRITFYLMSFLYEKKGRRRKRKKNSIVKKSLLFYTSLHCYINNKIFYLVTFTRDNLLCKLQLSNVIYILLLKDAISYKDTYNDNCKVISIEWMDFYILKWSEKLTKTAHFVLLKSRTFMWKDNKHIWHICNSKIFKI